MESRKAELGWMLIFVGLSVYLLLLGVMAKAQVITSLTPNSGIPGRRLMFSPVRTIPNLP